MGSKYIIDDLYFPFLHIYIFHVLGSCLITSLILFCLIHLIFLSASVSIKFKRNSYFIQFETNEKRNSVKNRYLKIDTVDKFLIKGRGSR